MHGFQIKILKKCSVYCTKELKNIHNNKKDIAEMHRVARFYCKFKNDSIKY